MRGCFHTPLLGKPKLPLIKDVEGQNDSPWAHQHSHPSTHSGMDTGLGASECPALPRGAQGQGWCLQRRRRTRLWCRIIFQASSSARPWSVELVLPGDNQSGDKSPSCTGLHCTAIVLGEEVLWMDGSSKSETQQERNSAMGCSGAAQPSGLM